MGLSPHSSVVSNDLKAPVVRESLLKPLKSSNRSIHFLTQAIDDGRDVLLDESFHRGLEIVRSLEQRVVSTSSRATFAERTANAERLHTLSKRLWVRFDQHTVRLEGVTLESLLQTLYPSTATGYLSFPAIREIAGAAKRVREGVRYPVLGRRLHPFFGVYFPTRTEHLELFATWLSQYKGMKDHCVDVGTGSGILTFLLAKSGFNIIDAIDQNPNAIWSVHEELRRHPIDTTIRLHCADLLSPVTNVNLIVFNPPWIPGKSNSSVTEALFFDGGLFDRFFEQAYTRLSDDGTIVLVFSTILTLLRPDIPHPIESELTKGRFKLQQKLQRKVKPTGGNRTKEKVQIWELVRV